MQKCFQTNNFNVRTKWSLANLSRANFAARISLWRKLETIVLTFNFGKYIIPHKKRFVPRESSLYQALRHWSSYCNIQNSTLTCHNRQLNERVGLKMAGLLILNLVPPCQRWSVRRAPAGWLVCPPGSSPPWQKNFKSQRPTRVRPPFRILIWALHLANVLIAHHGLLQLCVSASDLTPSWWYIRSTEREVPMEWPDSTVITPAILPDWWTATRSGFQKI